MNHWIFFLNTCKSSLSGFSHKKNFYLVLGCALKKETKMHTFSLILMHSRASLCILVTYISRSLAREDVFMHNSQNSVHPYVRDNNNLTP